MNDSTVSTSNIFTSVGVKSETDTRHIKPSVQVVTDNNQDCDSSNGLKIKATPLRLSYTDDRINDPEIREWMKQRQLGVGASEIAVLFGLSPFQTLRELWYDKVNECAYEPGIEIFHWGHEMEPLIAAEFERRTGEKVALPPEAIMVGDKPQYRASLDRVIVERGVPVAALELKNLNDSRFAEYKVGGPSIGYLLQLQYQMAVAGYDYGYLACLFGGQRWAAWRVIASPSIQKEIFDRVDEFWGYVKSGVEPPLVIGKRQVSSANPDGVLSLDASKWEDRLKSLEQIRLEKTQLDKKEKILKEEIKEVMGDSVSAEAGQMIASLSYSCRKRLDTKTLKAEHPELVEKYIVESESVALRVRNQSN
jgi:putative phage-type endonuclease